MFLYNNHIYINIHFCNLFILAAKSRGSDEINLESIQLSYIALDRDIPVNICKLKSLTEIKLQNCSLTGSILSEFSELVCLVSLNLNKNKLTGSLPESLTNLTRLERLDFSDNLLTGRIPSQYANFASVEIMSFQGNDLRGPIDPRIIKAPKLINFECDMIPYVDRSSINFAEKPKIKTFIYAQESFDFLKSTSLEVTAAESKNHSRDVLLQLYKKYKDVSESECDFDAFSEWGNPDMSKWQGIHVDSKGNIESLVLRSYKLSKKFPSIFSSELSSLKYLDLSDNSLVGDISDNWASFSSLLYLHLDHNGLTSSCLDEILPKFIDLKYINLSNNQFSGALPPRLGELIYLEEVHLNSNKFDGLLPMDYGNLVNLRVLNLANNQVSGCIPEEYSNLQDLQLLDVSNNNLIANGVVPSSIAKICKL